MFGLFESDDGDEDEGCNSHHYGEFETVDDLRLRSHNLMANVWLLEQKQRRKCVHSGCQEKEVSWETVGGVATEDLVSFVDEEDESVNVISFAETFKGDLEDIDVHDKDGEQSILYVDSADVGRASSIDDFYVEKDT